MRTLCLLIAAVTAVRADCYADEADPFLYFSTKTSNKFIRNDDISPITLSGYYLISISHFNICWLNLSGYVAVPLCGLTLWRHLFSDRDTKLKLCAPLGCTPAQMWQFSRHGTRYPRNDVPNEAELDNMAAILPRLRDDIVANHQAGRGTCSFELVYLLKLNWGHMTLHIERLMKMAVGDSQQTKVWVSAKAVHISLDNTWSEDYEFPMCTVSGVGS